MKWITAGDIKNWANGKQRHCQETLPELVCRLIWGVSDSIEEIDFPSGDNISVGGWDGRLKTKAITPFFPKGISGWEIGAGNSPGKKAEQDYKKRTNNPLGLPRKKATFVFVTPRLWPQKTKWQNRKRASKKWKDVRVVNQVDLEKWLDSVPGTALWLARQIGKISPNNDVRDLEAVWEEWSQGTNPAMTPDLVIAGRKGDVEEIKKWLSQAPGILEVQGDHPNEVYVFLYSAIATLASADRMRAFGRCVVVNNINEFRQLIQAFQKYPLIIVAPGECVNAAPLATAKGHHVFICMDSTVVSKDNIIRLSRPQRSIIEKLLHERGLPESKAQQLARDCGHSVQVLWRQLFKAKAISAPEWATPKSAQILIPVLFAGSWNEGKEGDRQIIETLSNQNYETFIKKLSPFLSIEDSPIRKIGNIWMLKSPLDAWFLLARHINNNDLKLYRQSILAILTKTKPKYDLPAEQRWAAAIYGKSSPYSEWLRTGLVESLVLLAVHGSRSPQVTFTQAFADDIIKEIFIAADKWEMWASLNDVIVLLAEAAPDAFMGMVEQWLAKNSKVFRELMEDDSSMFGECKHSGLLWALEGLAWSSEYFCRAVGILCELAKIDPGGKWSNRPQNTLRDIFLPDFPQTYAMVEKRLAVLEIIISKYPGIVWEFGQRYFNRGSFTESHRFRWRDAGGTRRGLEPENRSDNQKYLSGLLLRLGDVACAKENLISSIDVFARLPNDMQARILSEFKKIDANVFAKEERIKLLDCTRRTLNWISNHGDKEGKRAIPALSDILEKFAPEDIIECVGWVLSSPWPRLPQELPKDYKEKEVIIKEAQLKAARRILDKTSMENIIKFAGTIQYSGILGYALAKAVLCDKEDAAVLDAMIKHIEAPVLIQGYARGRVEVIGSRWVDNQIARMETQGNYSAEACALLYFGLPEDATTWSAVSRRGKDVERVYWKRASGYLRADKKEDVQVAVEKMLDVQRPDTALQIAGSCDVSISSKLLQRLLQEYLLMDEKKIRSDGMEAYYLGKVFNQLYTQNELPIEQIAELEWPFAAFFKEIKSEISVPMALHRLLQKEPLFFAQLISFIYKRDDGKVDPICSDSDKENTKKRALVAREVLDSWSLIPGLKENGMFDGKKLTNWVEVARHRCAEISHVKGGDIQIGFLLSHAPSDSDGMWPHVAVRNLIERLGNDCIEEHIQVGIINSRGVTSRNPSDGGTQERNIADSYKKMSGAIKVKWPRTGEMLRSIAKSYEHQADREDLDSELDSLR